MISAPRRLIRSFKKVLISVSDRHQKEKLDHSKNFFVKGFLTRIFSGRFLTSRFFFVAERSRGTIFCLLLPPTNSSIMSIVTEFNDYRAKMNEEILAQDNLVLKRFFNLDSNAYQDGALDKKTKELLGLIASMVLRCDDCIRYHLGKCFELGVNRDEVFEVFAIANLVGGSICIPHTRRAVEYWSALEEGE